MNKLASLLSAATLGAVAQVAIAQQAPVQAPVDTRAVDRAVESQSKPNRAATGAKKIANTVPDTSVGFSIASLKEVRVSGQLLNNEVTDYWLSFMRKPVSAAQLAEFKKWVYARLDDKQILGFVEIKEDKAADGSALLVEVVPITVGKITVLVNDAELGQKYSTDVVQRFTSRFKTGDTLDSNELEAQLNAAAFDLPLVLDVSLYPTGRSADIVINMAAAPYQLGRFQSGSVQVNNYGLSQYGRAQGLAVASFDGFTPLSTATFGALAAEHVMYLRGQYDLPLIGSGTRVQLWGSATRAEVSTIQSNASEVGLRLTGLMGVTANSISQWATEVGANSSEIKLSGLDYDKFNNYQARLRVNSDLSMRNGIALNNEFALTAGRLDIVDINGSVASDRSAYKRNGSYTKFEFAGGLSKPISEDETIAASMRWRGQLASKNMNPYNKISLGGPTGIRAYGKADGTGDSGAVLSFDLTKSFSQAFKMGVLYDVGRVVLNQNPLATDTGNQLTLQGAGLSFGGVIDNYNWSGSVAKSFGTGQNVVSDPTLTPVGDWRMNMEVTRNF